MTADLMSSQKTINHHHVKSVIILGKIVCSPSTVVYFLIHTPTQRTTHKQTHLERNACWSEAARNLRHDKLLAGQSSHARHRQFFSHWKVLPMSNKKSHGRSEVALCGSTTWWNFKHTRCANHKQRMGKGLASQMQVGIAHAKKFNSQIV